MTKLPWREASSEGWRIRKIGNAKRLARHHEQLKNVLKRKEGKSDWKMVTQRHGPAEDQILRSNGFLVLHNCHHIRSNRSNVPEPVGRRKLELYVEFRCKL